uniref:BZIP domain-containing protein n=1 Tax=Panagrolaimus sp. ES5 TaxID=591445 RepID=A0AC34F7I4_9BILA
MRLFEANPFTTEETNRYEELSKAQFADFYRTVAVPSKSSSFGQSNLVPSSSRLTSFSTTPSTSVFRPTFGGDQEDSQHSDCHRSDDGYGSNDSGFGSHSEDERNGDDRSNNGEMFYNILEDIPEPQQQHFDNITIAYQPYAPEENLIIPQQSSVPTAALVQSTTPSDEPSPVLGHYTENGPETLETTLQLDEDEYLKYVTNQQVLEDISQSAAEQSFEAADEVLERIQRQHENSDIAVDFTPFDEPLPFFDDDFFLNVDETLVEAVATSHHNGALSSASGTSSSLTSSQSPSQNYRLYGKLVPEIKFENDENEQDENEYDDGDDIHSSDNKNHRRRGRQSKDNDLVKKHELPANAEELAAMSHKALQNLLKDPHLSDTQKSLIKRIRRRGRNKEAARKCRERRIMPSEGTSSPIKLEPATISTSNEKIVHRPFIIYPPTRTTKVA